MNTKKLEVGQTVFLLGMGPNSRYMADRVTERKITKVGRKWFEVEHARHAFCIATGNQKPTDYMAEYQAYFDRETMDNERAEKRDRAALQSMLNTYPTHRAPIEQVRAILKILNP